MMGLARIFGLTMLFLFFESAVVVATKVFLPKTDIFIACLSMTGLGVGAFVILYVCTRLFSRRAAKPVAPQPRPFVPGKTNQADEAFKLELGLLIAEADRRLKVLRPSHGKNQQVRVSSLPLYLVAGAEGSGKTSLIVNSGLEPILIAGEAEKDGNIVPTAIGNIWYAKEGILFVELAGRHLMQDAGRWECVLQALTQRPHVRRWKRVLRPRPARNNNVRGVILACEVGALLKPEEQGRTTSIARALNQRLQSVQTLMRPDFPAYVFFTKCDAVPYFKEFFSRLVDSEARRILGVTLPQEKELDVRAGAYAEREGSRLNKLFNRLYQSLAHKRMVLLAREDSVEKRSRAYEFPREFRKLRNELVLLLLDVFRPSALASTCRFRGFYFCGKRSTSAAATHEGTDSFVQLDTGRFRKPLDATFILSSKSATAILDHGTSSKPRERDRSQWSFLAEVFELIILRDPAAHSTAPAPAVVDSRMANIVCAVAGVVCLAISINWVFSWENNRRLIRDVTEAVAGTRQYSGQTPVDMLPDLESLRPMVARLHAYNRGSSPLQYHWGLYAGGRAGATLDHLYYGRFRTAVLDPSLGAMRDEFLRLKPSSPVSDDVYRDLKAYRAMTSGACKADQGLVESTLLPFWRDAVTRNPEDQALASQQIDLYAGEVNLRDPFAHGIPENDDAVRNAQSYLLNLRGPDRVLQAVANQARNIPAETLSAYSGNYSTVLTGPDQVEGLYTREGWKQVEESIRDHKLLSSGEPCVVGSGSRSADWDAGAQMDAQVQSLYSKNYVDSWKQFLDRHQVTPFSGISDAAQKLHVLADNNHSPLLGLIYMASVNTNVVPPDGLLNKIEQRATHAWGQFTGQGQTGPAAGPQSVASAFDSVHAMVDPGNPQRWLNPTNQPYIRALNDLGDVIQTLPAVFHRDSPVEMQQRQQAFTSVAAADGAYNALAGGFPNSPDGVDIVLEKLLRQPINLARRAIEAIPVVDPPPPPAPGGSSGAAIPHLAPAADKEEQKRTKAIIDKVNAGAKELCGTEAQLDQKFPFNPLASEDITMQELDHLLKPGTGEYPLLAGKQDFSAAYGLNGNVWTEKLDFPAVYSQPFLVTLNSFREVKDELYGATPGSAYFKLTLTLDGTGHIPYELSVDGHTLRYSPGHPPAPLQLEWPPITNAPTRLIVHNGAHGGAITTGQFTGPWSLFHLLQMADIQNGGTFVFQTVQFGHGLNPLVNEHGQPGTIQIHVSSSAGNPLGRGYFGRLRCAESWALQPKNP
jgi:type VI secretion system protein ImpL